MVSDVVRACGSVSDNQPEIWSKRTGADHIVMIFAIAITTPNISSVIFGSAGEMNAHKVMKKNWMPSAKFASVSSSDVPKQPTIFLKPREKRDRTIAFHCMWGQQYLDNNVAITCITCWNSLD